MAEYIERGKLRDKIAFLQNQRKADGQHLLSAALDSVLFVIDKAPAADVEPVVRCAKCVFRSKSGRCAKSGLYMVDRGFCSYGERGKGDTR